MLQSSSLTSSSKPCLSSGHQSPKLLKAIKGFDCKINDQVLGAVLLHSNCRSDGQVQTEGISKSVAVIAGSIYKKCCHSCNNIIYTYSVLESKRFECFVNLGPWQRFFYVKMKLMWKWNSWILREDVTDQSHVHHWAMNMASLGHSLVSEQNKALGLALVWNGLRLLVKIRDHVQHVPNCACAEQQI